MVHIDETHFEECTIKDCLLIYSGGEFSWSGTQLKDGNKVRIVGAARRVVEFMADVGFYKAQPAAATPVPPMSEEPEKGLDEQA